MLRDRPSFASALNTSSRVALPFATFWVWGMVAFSAVAWGLRWTATGTTNTAVSAVQSTPDVDISAAARTLGVAPAQATASPSLASRFQLLGVLSRGDDAGAALMAVDGQPAKPYRVGAAVADGLVLQTAMARLITLGPSMDGPSTLVLELPAKK